MMSTTGRMKGSFVVLILQHVMSCECGIHSEQYIQTFKEVCPYNNLCNENASKVNINPDLSPCCEECSCEADCKSFQNCCLDAVTFVVTDQSSVIPCVPWYKVYDITFTIDDPWQQQYGYRVISSCPPINIFNQSTELCEKTSRSLDNVVSDAKGRVYRNEHCALCHGVTAFTKWEIRFMSCDGLFLQTFFSQVDRDNYVVNHCSPVAVPPEEKVNRCVLNPNRTCSKSIESDSLRSDACNDTTNNFIIYRQFLKRLIAYANVDCFLCSNPVYGNSDIDHLCNVQYFESKSMGKFKDLLLFTLIDYQRSINTYVHTDGVHCNVTEVYDHITKKCRTLICPRGSIAIDGQCVNFVEMTGMAILFTVPIEITSVRLGKFGNFGYLNNFATVLEEYVLTTYAISCALCRTPQPSPMMRFAVSSTCPIESLHNISREMSTTLTYLNVTVNGSLITVPVFANVAEFEPLIKSNQIKPILTSCNHQSYFVAGLAFPVHECPSVQLSFADMKNAGITNAEVSKLTFSGCFDMKSKDPNMLNISYFRNIIDNCHPSILQTNASRVYTVCIDSYLRLRNSSSSAKWVDLLRFSITVFFMFYLFLFT